MQVLTRSPNALLPFAAPTSSSYTVSADSIAFFSKAAIGFSNSSALNRNFETNGKAWLEINTMANFPAGGGTFIDTFEFHTNELSGPSVSGVFQGDPYPYNRMAVSYDPVNHIASASINGVVVAQLPYTAAPIKYVGIKGSWYASFDNFQVNSGAIQQAPAAASSSTSTSLFSSTSVASDPVLGSSTGSVL